MTHLWSLIWRSQDHHQLILRWLAHLCVQQQVTYYTEFVNWDDSEALLKLDNCYLMPLFHRQYQLDSTQLASTRLGSRRVSI